MKLTLARFNSEEVEIDPATLIEFPGGLPGFEECTQFKLFHEGENPRIFWLQSVDDTQVVFSLADPDLFNLSYELNLTDEEQEALNIEEGDELNVAVILSRSEENAGNEQNSFLPILRLPIVINISKQLAIQKPLLDAELPARA